MDDWKKEKLEYTIFPDHLEEDEMMTVLLIEGVLFINNGWWYEKAGRPWPEDHITIHVICNDIFAWGCADSEDLLYGEISELYKMHKKDPIFGSAAWCIRKRKQMPQKPVEDDIRKAGIWNLEELINGK